MDIYLCGSSFESHSNYWLIYSVEIVSFWSHLSVHSLFHHFSYISVVFFLFELCVFFFVGFNGCFHFISRWESKPKKKMIQYTQHRVYKKRVSKSLESDIQSSQNHLGFCMDSSIDRSSLNLCVYFFIVQNIQIYRAPMCHWSARWTAFHFIFCFQLIVSFKYFFLSLLLVFNNFIIAIV